MKLEKFIASLWIGMGMFLCIGAVRLNLGHFHKPGPGFISFLAGSLLGLAGFLLFMGQLVEKRKGGEGKGRISIDHFWKKGVWLLIASFGYCLFLDPLGFVISTVLLIFILIKIMGNRRWFFPFLTSVLVAIITYLAFNVWLRINLPRGILGIG